MQRSACMCESHYVKIQPTTRRLAATGSAANRRLDLFCRNLSLLLHHGFNNSNRALCTRRLVRTGRLLLLHFHFHFHLYLHHSLCLGGSRLLRLDHLLHLLHGLLLLHHHVSGRHRLARARCLLRRLLLLGLLGHDGRHRLARTRHLLGRLSLSLNLVLLGCNDDRCNRLARARRLLGCLGLRLGHRLLGDKDGRYRLARARHLCRHFVLWLYHRLHLGCGCLASRCLWRHLGGLLHDLLFQRLLHHFLGRSLPLALGRSLGLALGRSLHWLFEHGLVGNRGHLLDLLEALDEINSLAIRLDPSLLGQHNQLCTSHGLEVNTARFLLGLFHLLYLLSGHLGFGGRRLLRHFALLRCLVHLLHLILSVAPSSPVVLLAGGDEVHRGNADGDMRRLGRGDARSHTFPAPLGPGRFLLLLFLFDHRHGHHRLALASRLLDLLLHSPRRDRLAAAARRWRGNFSNLLFLGSMGLLLLRLGHFGHYRLATAARRLLDLLLLRLHHYLLDWRSRSNGATRAPALALDILLHGRSLQLFHLCG
mmetsp:Transcript_22442/g.32905  ORF Transcript_22442/g.32905 Transcript_22442/m.32905 type:complete len:536 (-) Transcript_22442:1731-3338(-)